MVEAHENDFLIATTRFFSSERVSPTVATIELTSMTLRAPVIALNPPRTR